ncbi:NlpC/P60 family protein [Streptantibioticus rubrisoli]
MLLVLSVTVAASADVALSGPASHAVAHADAAVPVAVSQARAKPHSTRFEPTVANPTTATAAQLATGTRSAVLSSRLVPRSTAAQTGKPISRSVVMARAQSWIAEGVPYNRNAYNSDSNGTYRQDCSGFVSMAWSLPSSQANNYGETTGTLTNFATELNSLDDLQPGDMLDNISTHVVLFKGWADANRTTAMILEEAHSGTTAREDDHFYTRNYLSTHRYRPYRYNRIQDAAPPDVTDPDDDPGPLARGRGRGAK